jgi:drug/metabolite transporter superfamily protein YnfA
LGVKNSNKSSRVFEYFKKGFNKPGFDTITVNIGGTFSKFLENIEPKFILFSTITSITSAILSLFVYLTILNPDFNIFGSAFEIFGDVYTVLEIVVYFLINGLLILFLLISVILWVRYYRRKKKMRFQI